MNVNQIVNMVVRMVMRRLLKQGVDAGVNAVGKRMGKGKSPDAPQQTVNTGSTGKRMRQTMKVTRKIGRF